MILKGVLKYILTWPSILVLLPSLDVKSVAVIGAGPSGAAAAAALKAEKYYDTIRVFERRAVPGGTWIYDPDTSGDHRIRPGELPPSVDPAIEIPKDLPQTTPPDQRERWHHTPIYRSLTTNVPDLAMSFSDIPFPYGPFVPHHVARSYIENYFAAHHMDDLLELNTTVEDMSQVATNENRQGFRWKLSLRKYDDTRQVDVWWRESFDAVILANGHFGVPYIPKVKGLEAYLEQYPNRIKHSNYYRTPHFYQSKRVVIVGNSASGYDISVELSTAVKSPLYVSRRSRGRFDGDEPPAGVEWKPTIDEFRDDGAVVFSDGTVLEDVDVVLYCTGYKASYPFWNSKANKRSLWDYEAGRIPGTYLHTFLQDFPTVGLVGLPITISWRSYEYQGIAHARHWSNRNSNSLPPLEEQQRWEREWVRNAEDDGRKFHMIPWDTGDTKRYLDFLFKFAGLGTLGGEGRLPPVLSPEVVWALEHIKKYPNHRERSYKLGEDNVWIVVDEKARDTEERDTIDPL